jgi:putative ABC transport system permease protein
MHPEGGDDFAVTYINTDKNFFKTLDINIIKGEENIENLENNPNWTFKDFPNRYVVNEKFLRSQNLSLDDIDKQKYIIKHGNMQPGSIIGVVDDFHFQSLHSEIGPLVIEFYPYNMEYLLIKISPNDIQGTLSFIENQWNTFAGGLPFSYSFLDQDFATLYRSERQTSQLFLLFTCISIFIIMLGLFGLISFTITRKTKEIGIRKVLGASSENIVLWMLRELMKWLILANVIALPVAWYLMHKWLHNFAFHVELSPAYFLGTATLAFIIAFCTVFFQTQKAANSNPVDALKYE